MTTKKHKLGTLTPKEKAAAKSSRFISFQGRAFWGLKGHGL